MYTILFYNFSLFSPCLSTGSSEIFIKMEKENRFFLFLSPKGVEGGGVGGQNQGTCPLESFFFIIIDALPYYTEKILAHLDILPPRQKKKHCIQKRLPFFLLKKI